MSDQYRRAYTPSQKQIDDERKENKNSSLLQSLENEANSFADKLTINPDNITADSMSKISLDDIVSYSYINIDNALFPNFRDIFPQKENEIKRLHLYKKSYASGQLELESVVANISGGAKQIKLRNYFLSEVSNFDQENKLDAFIEYLKKDFKRDYSKELASMDNLTLDNVKEIIAKTKSEKRNFEDIDLLIKYPEIYNKEQADRILKKQWFFASKNDDRIIRYYYDGTDVPSHMGMKEEDVAFRKSLDAAYKKISNQSIYDLKFGDTKYFDILYSEGQYGELLAEHRDEFVEEVKATQKLQHFVNALELNNDQQLANTNINKDILKLLEDVSTKDNEKDIFYARDKNKIVANLMYKISNNSIKDKDFLKEFIIENDNVYQMIDKSFEKKEGINSDTLKLLYQTAWLYDNGSKTPEKLQEEYFSLFSENINDVRETNNKFSPVGSSRFDILLKRKRIKTIAKYNSEKFINLPVEKTRPLLQDANVYADDNFNVKEEYKEVFDMLNKYIDKHGLKTYEENNSKNNVGNLLAYRYAAGIRNPEEIQKLRELKNGNKVLENLFAQENRTLYQAKDIASLIFDESNKEKIAIILKDGYQFKNEEDKYALFNELIKKSYYDDRKDTVIYSPYINDLINKTEIDFKKAENYDNFSSEYMLDFAIKNYNKTPKIDKKYLDHIVAKATKDKNIDDASLVKLQKLGYSIKTNFAYDLIDYYRGKSIYIDLQGKDLAKYDFDAKFQLNKDYHPSSGSHTTFLNEMLQYGKAKEAAIALNNGASPFTKAGFFRNKFEATPFNMLFGRELKQNNSENLQSFMTIIAQNLNEDKKGVMKDIWNSLGQKMRDDPKVKEIISKTDQILNSRDFANENRQKEEALKKIEEDRIRQEKERIKQAEQRQIIEAKIQRDRDIYELKKKAIASLSDIINLDETAIVEGLASYLKENKDTLKALPNKEELDEFKEEALEKKEFEIKCKEKRDSEKRKEINDSIEQAIKDREKEASSILSLKEVGELIQERFQKDEEAKPFIMETIKSFQDKTKAKLKRQESLSKVEEIAADKLIGFFENEHTHGFDFFNSVGYNKRNEGYEKVTKEVMLEMGFELPGLNIYHEPLETQDLFFKIQGKVEALEREASELAYFDEKLNTWVDSRQYDFLADKAGHDKAKPEKTVVDEKEALKSAKKNSKNETPLSSLEALAALQSKFNKRK